MRRESGKRAARHEARATDKKRGRVRFGQRTVLVPSHTPARAWRRRVPALRAGGSERSSPDRFHADHGVADTEHAGCCGQSDALTGPSLFTPAPMSPLRRCRRPRVREGIRERRESRNHAFLPSRASRAPQHSNAGPRGPLSGRPGSNPPGSGAPGARPEAGTRATPVSREPEQALTYPDALGKCEAAV